jgi:hypothetical protein
MFESKKEKLKAGWRKLHNEELDGLYCSPDTNMFDEMGEVCGTYGGEEKCTQGFGREI